MKLSTSLISLSLAALSLAQSTVPPQNPQNPNPDTPSNDGGNTDCSACATLLSSPDACSPAWAEQVAACMAPPCNRDYATDPLADCLPTDTASVTVTVTDTPTGSMTVQPTGGSTAVQPTDGGDGGSMTILPTDSISVPEETMPSTGTGVIGGGGGNGTATVSGTGRPTGSDEPDEDGAAASLQVGGMGVIGAFVVGLAGLLL